MRRGIALPEGPVSFDDDPVLLAVLEDREHLFKLVRVEADLGCT